MTVTWALVLAIAACAVWLAVFLFRPFRSCRTHTEGTGVRSAAWIDLLGVVSPIVAAAVLAVVVYVSAQRVIDHQEVLAGRARQQAASQDKACQRAEQMQRRLSAVDRFLPQFSKSELDKSAAILAIRATGDLDLAVTLAGLFPSAGSANALETIARQGGPDDHDDAARGLGVMNTEQSAAALSRLFGATLGALVPFEGETPGEHTRKVVAGVLWNDRWLLVPLGELVNVSARNLQGTKERVQQSFGDRLTRIRLANTSLPPASSGGIQFAEALPERGDAVFAVGLDSAGRPGDPRMGVVSDVRSDGLRVTFARAPEQVPGSLLVLPSGAAVGVLSHDQPQTGSRHYIRGDGILSWLKDLDHADADRERQR